MSYWMNAGKTRVFSQDLTADNKIRVLLYMLGSTFGDSTVPEVAADLDAATVGAFDSGSDPLGAINEYDGAGSSAGDIYPSKTAEVTQLTDTSGIGIGLYDTGATGSTRSDVPTLYLDASQDRGAFGRESGGELNYNFQSLANGSAAIEGMFFCISPTPGSSQFTAHWPLAVINDGGFGGGINPGGGDLQVNFSASNGILYIA